MAEITQRAAQYWAGRHNVAYRPENGSETFKAGEWVKLTSGKVTVCASNETTFYGMVLEDATGVEDTKLAILLPLESTLFIANVYHSVKASAVTAENIVGVKYALLVDSNKHYVDIEDTGNDAFVIDRMHEGDEVGDIYGRVIFRVLNAVKETDVKAT